MGIEKNITLNGTIATLRVFYQFLIDEDYIDEKENPMQRIKNLKEEKNVILMFNDAEVKRILSDVKEETYSNVRDKLILIMLFDTGVRVSELCGILNEDVTRGHILILGKGSKERLVYISRIMRRSVARRMIAVIISRRNSCGMESMFIRYPGCSVIMTRKLQRSIYAVFRKRTFY